ncbi:MAG: hypothetical protein DMG51_15650 [Acidobacteria bacterium]|nr:MAG: hypothetical protein DMG51_15650 [Acidobacteriota bacterium]
MLDAIVSNKTFGNATFRQFVIRGFQNFRGLLFAACSSEKSPPPAVATPSVSPIPMPNGIIFREISERYRWSWWEVFFGHG